MISMSEREKEQVSTILDTRYWPQEHHLSIRVPNP